MPEATCDGRYLHETIPAMAAVYTYHICQNQPYIDGNKRAALASSLVFLDINGYGFNCDEKMLFIKIMNTAKGEIKKEELVLFYEKYSVKNERL